MGGNLSAEIFQETPATAANFLRNGGNRRLFSDELPAVLRFFFRRSAVVVENFQPKFRPGI